MKRIMHRLKLNPKGMKYTIYGALGILIITFAAILSYYLKTSDSAKKLYREADGKIIVILNKKADDDTLRSLTSTFDTPVEVQMHMDDYALLLVKDERRYKDVLNSLFKNPLVKTAQANSKISILGLYKDTFARAQWSINNPGRYASYTEKGWDVVTSTEDVDMDTVKAWDYMKNEKSDHREVTVAIIDTGVDYTHPDLAQNMWKNKGEIPDDGIDNDNNGYIDDVNGWDFYNGDNSVCHYTYDNATGDYKANQGDNDNHGTHIAGIIGAVLNNNIGIEGIASGIDIKLMALKINGGEDGTGSISDAIEAIKYATMMGADICNISWGTSEYSSALKEVMKESDMLFVTAAGNTGTDNENNPVYPASFRLDNSISVTFVDADGTLSRLSNYGQTAVDVAAPGVDIFSTIVGGYDTMSGSSMSTPHVSAVAALLYSYSNYLYASNVKQAILNNIKPLPGLKGFMLYPGIPSAYKAVTAVCTLNNDTDPPEISFKTVYKNGEFQIPLNVQDKGGAGIRVIRFMYGDKTLSDFNHGMAGTLAQADRITVSKAGKYTIYASDYAGNDMIKTCEVVEDTTPPTISAAYTVSDSYKTRTVTLTVSDNQSNVKRVKYMAGIKEASDFLPAGTGSEVRIIDNKGTFKVRFDGIYSIYATDNRGNNVVKLVNIETVKATALSLTRYKKMMYTGSRYNLTAHMKPYNSTDKLVYSSDNISVATVSASGEIKALKKGKAYISVRTSSGFLKTCLVTVID